MIGTAVDITPITSAVVQILAAIILAMGTWAIGRAVQWLGLKNSQQISENLDKALEKAVTYGIQQAQEEIRIKGWDSIQVKNETLAHAMPYFIERFSDTLRAAGINPSGEQINNLVKGALDRAYPQAVSKAAASPATPPVTAPNPPVVHDLPAQAKPIPTE